MPSPNHARSIYLILNPATGHVSPQFHSTAEDFFETVKGDMGYNSPVPDWIQLSGLSKAKTNRPKNRPTKDRAVTPVASREVEIGEDFMILAREPLNNESLQRHRS